MLASGAAVAAALASWSQFATATTSTSSSAQPQSKFAPTVLAPAGAAPARGSSQSSPARPRSQSAIAIADPACAAPAGGSCEISPARSRSQSAIAGIPPADAASATGSSSTSSSVPVATDGWAGCRGLVADISLVHDEPTGPQPQPGTPSTASRASPSCAAWYAVTTAIAFSPHFLAPLGNAAAANAPTSASGPRPSLWA